MDQQNKQSRIKSKRLPVVLALAIVLMFGFSYALVPMYNAFCKWTGINGKVDGQTIMTQSNARVREGVDTQRVVTVQFMSTNNDTLPWTLKPSVHSVDVHPGEKKYVHYYARNNSPEEMTIQAIPSISPGQAAAHLQKTQCFCFDRQTLKPGEEKEMGIMFHLGTDLPAWINTVTLSYTFFDVSDREADPNQPTGRITP